MLNYTIGQLITMEYLLENGYFDENYKIYSLKYGVFLNVEGEEKKSTLGQISK